MATFEEHIKQASKNLHFLSEINSKVSGCFDWQVTVSFYTAVHLVNAHLSNYELQYRRHSEVNHALNPYNQVSVSKIPEDEYKSYIKLQQLSRRSRYLANTRDNNLGSDHAFYTYEKHFGKSLHHLDKLISYFNDKYNLSIEKIRIKCSVKKASDFSSILLIT